MTLEETCCRNEKTIQLFMQLKKEQLHEGVLHVKIMRATCNNILRVKLHEKFYSACNSTLKLVSLLLVKRRQSHRILSIVGSKQNFLAVHACVFSYPELMRCTNETRKHEEKGKTESKPCLVAVSGTSNKSKQETDFLSQ